MTNSTPSPADVAAALVKAATPIKTKAKAPKAKTVLSPKALRAVKTLAKAKADVKAAEGRKDRAEAIIRAELGDSFEIGTTADGVPAVTVMHSSNSHYAGDILVARFPEAAEASYVKTPYTFLRTA